MDSHGNTDIWSIEQTQQLIDLAKAGHNASEICKAMGRTYSSIATKATRINLRYRNSRSPANFDFSEQTDKPCIRCRYPIISTWAGNRVCEECKASDAWRYA